MTPRKPKPRKPAKPVLAWGVVAARGRLLRDSFGFKTDAEWVSAEIGGRIVRVEIREVRK